jgi:hypothetical protein
MLHITNGESVVHSFREGAIPGSYLSWNDVLHDGPVPATSTLSELSDIRAQVLSQLGAGSYDQIRSGFAARDQALADFHQHDEVVLWFEHDLCDQLQLLQLLDWFSAHDLSRARLSLIQINAFPGVEPFHGLGQLKGSQLDELLPTRKPVTVAQLLLARKVWQAFRASDPAALASLITEELAELPFLRKALLRFLEEYPSVRDGLPRAQRQILHVVAAGARRKRDIYAASRQFEECPWGDGSIYWRIDALASTHNPALEKTAPDEYQITEFGRHLLAGKADWVSSSGDVDIWLGGVHLAGAEVSWRWNDDQQTLSHLYSSTKSK